MKQLRPNIVAALGASGTGKSLWVKRTYLQPAPARLLVWSPLEETDAYAETPGAMLIRDDAPALVTAASSAKDFRLVFQPSQDKARRDAQFRTFCKLAFALGRLTVIVEELRFVTTPSRAPEPWANLTLQGRHRQLVVIATSQRPASIDKDFVGNCSVIHSGALTYPEDEHAVAKAMRIDPAKLAELQDLEFLHWTRSPRALVAGRMRPEPRKELNDGMATD